MKITHEVSEHDFEVIHHYLAKHAYWCKNIPAHTLKQALENSLCFIIKNNKDQLIGFARVVSDFATFANLLDVFILDNYQGQGYGKALINAVVSHHTLQGLRRFTLATKDAHGLYQQFGFKEPKMPETAMEIYVPNMYKQ